jgi:hypothetical protein
MIPGARCTTAKKERLMEYRDLGEVDFRLLMPREWWVDGGPYQEGDDEESLGVDDETLPLFPQEGEPDAS